MSLSARPGSLAGVGRGVIFLNVLHEPMSPWEVDNFLNLHTLMLVKMVRLARLARLIRTLRFAIFCSLPA